MVNRGDIALLGAIPGLEHAYLRTKDGLWTILLGYVCVVTLFFLMIQCENKLGMASSWIGVYFSMAFQSTVEIEYLLNLKKIPYSGTAYEAKIKNYCKAYIASAIIPGMVSLIILSVDSVINYEPYKIAGILILISYIVTMVSYAKKYRNKRYSDMICPGRDV